MWDPYAKFNIMISHNGEFIQKTEFMFVPQRYLKVTYSDNGGVLGKMKAQLRAHVYSALEKGEVPANSALVNPNLRSFLDTTTGRLIASLVRYNLP